MKTELETEYYGNGQKREEVSYKDGKKDGLWTGWYENGQQQFEGKYKDGEREGLWTFWYENGQERGVENYKNGKKDGRMTHWYKNGEKSWEAYWKNGKKEGSSIWWFESGYKMIEGCNKDGNRDGLWTQWFESGQKEFEVIYKDGKKEGRMVKSIEDLSFVKNKLFKDENIEDKVFTKLKLFTDNGGNLSYDYVRKIAIKEIDRLREEGVYRALERGRAILKTHEELNQYWWSYAPMIKRQLDHVFKCFDSFVESYEFIENNLEIIDYGCGQGGASIRFLDKFYKVFKTSISKIKLIEPSPIALQRARRVLECYSSDIQIVSINNGLDYVTHEEFITDINRTYIHLFSNILDIEGFNFNKLISKITLAKGRHFFIAVSPHDNSRGTRVRGIYESLITKTDVNKWVIVDNEIDDFSYIVNGEEKLAIYFIINLEVLG